MLLAPNGGPAAIEEGGADASDSSIATLTSNASANTKGTAVQLIAATLWETAWVIVRLSQNTTNVRFLVDIQIGSDVFIANIPSHFMRAADWAPTGPFSFPFPVRIPKGSQVQAACQDSTGSGTIDIQVTLIATTPTGPEPFNRVTTYGAVTASSGGTVVDPGGVSHTKSNTVIDASCANPLSAIMLAQTGDQLTASTSTFGRLTDVKAAGTIVIPDQHAYETASELIRPPIAFPFPCDIASGTSLSVDHQAGNTNATDRLARVILFGFD